VFPVPITSSFIAELVSLFVRFVPFVQWPVLVCTSASEHHVQAHVSPEHSTVFRTTVSMPTLLRTYERFGRRHLAYPTSLLPCVAMDNPSLRCTATQMIPRFHNHLQYWTGYTQSLMDSWRHAIKCSTRCAQILYLAEYSRL
jgi:hypothetical protein